jgi:polysaccharide export outer membrane protein
VRPAQIRVAVLAALFAGGCTPAPPPVVDPSFRPISKSGPVTVASAAALAEFEAPADEIYRISEGDKLSILVWGRPELSGRKIVGPDGRLSLPLAGSVSVALQTREEVAATLEKSLEKFYVHPSVSVEVDEYVGNRIVLLGRVESPGIIRFDGPPTLIEALSRAGALPVLDKKATLTRCAVVRGRDRILWVDLKALLSAGQLSFNIRLRQGDLVYIPDSDDTLVYVLGEVQRPGAYRLTPDMSLLDALAQAGGPTKDAASSKMKLVRTNSHLELDVPLASLLDPQGGRSVGLEEGDIIWVPRSGLARIGYVFEKAVSPFVNLVIVGKAIAN